MATDTVRPVSYVPHRFASGTFPVSRDYNLRQMLYNYSYSSGRVDSNADGDSSNRVVVPSFPFSDVPVFADTVDIETLAFHHYWGCLVTPDNVAARICTDDLRYHVWVATKRIVESGQIKLSDKEALIRAVMNQFMVELSLVLLDLCPGPLLLFVDPRLHDDVEGMVSMALEMVRKFDQAHVRRWRIMVSLPATEEGMQATRELTHKHGIQTHLSMASCLAHAQACIDAGAVTVSMGVEPIMEWFEQRTRGGSTSRTGAAQVTHDHPGIEAIQACANFIQRRGLNTTLLTTNVRKWSELKQLGGIGATALTKAQLDQIPMQRMVTWYPRLDSPDGQRVDASEDSSGSPHRSDANALVGASTTPPSTPPKKGLGFLATLPAESRSLVSAVLYVHLAKMAERMTTIEKVVWYEIKRRIKLETIPLEYLYRRPAVDAVETETHVRRRSRTPSIASTASTVSTTSTSSGRSSKSKHASAARRSSKEREREIMVEGVDYF